MATSGSNPNWEEDQPSSSPSPSEVPAPRPYQILVVEDNRADVFLIREALNEAGVNAELYVVPDGEKAIRFFNMADADDNAPCPILVILDINLPRKHGGEVLRQMRQTRKCADALVIVVTSSDSDQDRQQMAQLGANEYFRKSSEFREFMKLGEVVKRLLGQSEVPPPAP
ncbi:MAG TPA: response regulator [Bryobacteraceae bacterium]|nr:response regulator [Bryobacteraceae bacterium]